MIAGQPARQDPLRRLLKCSRTELLGLYPVIRVDREKGILEAVCC